MYLWGLTALLIPILIHLWSNKEGKVIRVGSLKFFPEEQTHRQKSFKINEIWLLLLRTLLVSLLVLALAEPVFHNWPASGKKVVLVERSVLHNSSVALVLDSLVNIGNYEPRFLQQDFPLIDDAGTREVETTPVQYWQLLQQASRSLQADSLVVLSQAKMEGFKGKRPILSVPIQWYTVPIMDSFEFIAEARRKGKLLAIAKVSTDAHQTEVRYEHLDENGRNSIDTKTIGKDQYVKLPAQDFWTKVKEPLSLRVGMWYAEDFLYDSYYIKAALRSIEQYFPVDISITNKPTSAGTKESGFDLAIWLSEQPLDLYGRKIMRYEPGPLSSKLVEPVLDGSRYRLTQRLSTENVFEQDLVAQLVPLIIGTKRLDSLLALYDQRVLPMPQNELARVHALKKEAPPRQASTPYGLWTLWAVLFLVERALSFLRDQ